MAWVCIIPSQQLSGQQPPADFRTSRYSPPVHIPPRVPLHDPGLPETLNGKFNSSQQIRSDSASGLRTVISDDSRYSGSQQRPIRATRQFNRVSSEQQPIANRDGYRRRAGLQDRISNLISGGFNQNRVASNGPERVVAPNNNIDQFHQRISAAVDSFRPERITNAARRPRTEQVRTDPRLNPQAISLRVAPPVPQDTQLANSAFGVPAVRSENRSQRPVDGEPDDLPINSRGRYTRVQTTSKQRPAPIAVQNRVSEPRAMAQQFQENLRSRSQSPQQTRLPVATKKTPATKPVSVLRRQTEEVMLDPPPIFDSNVELEVPESMDAAEFSEPAAESSDFNVLRGSEYTQDDSDQLGSDFDLEDDLELDGGFDNEGNDDDSDNPLRRSCEEFRSQLLNDPITNIALDISPPARTDLFGENVFHVWHDQFGNELAQGTLSDLRRGYAIIDSANGGQIRLPYARLSDADKLAISDYWRLPIECGLGLGTPTVRNWVPQTATWHASALCHKPLYFENVQLERYGHTHGPFLQPVASTVHFFGKLFFLPYNTAINPPNECQYALGFYRPGNCAPWLKDPFPISLRGAVRQGSFYTGVGLLTE